MANPRQVQRFIPRRDTFPGEKPIKAKALLPLLKL